MAPLHLLTGLFKTRGVAFGSLPLNHPPTSATPLRHQLDVARTRRGAWFFAHFALRADAVAAL